MLHAEPVLSAVFSGDDSMVLTASFDKAAKLWSAATGECLHTLSGHTKELISAVFSPNWQ